MLRNERLLDPQRQDLLRVDRRAWIDELLEPNLLCVGEEALNTLRLRLAACRSKVNEMGFDDRWSELLDVARRLSSTGSIAVEERDERS